MENKKGFARARAFVVMLPSYKQKIFPKFLIEKKMSRKQTCQTAILQLHLIEKKPCEIFKLLKKGIRRRTVYDVSIQRQAVLVTEKDPVDQNEKNAKAYKCTVCTNSTKSLRNPRGLEKVSGPRTDSTPTSPIHENRFHTNYHRSLLR